MRRDNVIIWLQILWALLGFLLYPLLYAFLPLFRTPYVIAAYIIAMMVGIYLIFIQEKKEEIAPMRIPLRIVLMTVINYRRGEKEEIAECVICLSEFKEEEKIARIDCCGGRYHEECIGRWGESKGRICPICRTSYLRG